MLLNTQDILGEPLCLGARKIAGDQGSPVLPLALFQESGALLSHVHGWRKVLSFESRGTVLG